MKEEVGARGSRRCAADHMRAVLSDDHWEEAREAIGLPKAVRPELLRQAFSHASFARENSMGATGSNQRLEFLGDAVLDLILAEYMYQAHPEIPEGELTRMKAAAVRSHALARLARQLELGQYMLLGRGEEDTGGREKPSLLADCFEALVGAVYLSTGLAATRRFVLSKFKAMLQEIEAKQSTFDHKTALQELLQERTKQLPQYVTVQTIGPPHARTFVVQVEFHGTMVGEGVGSSKQAAQQAAARVALDSRETWLKSCIGPRDDQPAS